MNKKHKAVEMEAEITFQKNIPFPRLKVQNAKVIDQMRCPPNFLGLESELPSEIERWLDKSEKVCKNCQLFVGNKGIQISYL